MDIAEQTQVNGLSIIGIMNIAMKLEAFGIHDIFSVIQQMFLENDDGNHYSPLIKGYHEGWSEFQQDVIPLIQDQMTKLIVIIRKKFC